MTCGDAGARYILISYFGDLSCTTFLGKEHTGVRAHSRQAPSATSDSSGDSGKARGAPTAPTTYRQNNRLFLSREKKKKEIGPHKVRMHFQKREGGPYLWNAHARSHAHTLCLGLEYMPSGCTPVMPSQNTRSNRIIPFCAA